MSKSKANECECDDGCGRKLNEMNGWPVMVGKLAAFICTSCRYTRTRKSPADEADEA
jgi:predicted Fe-S protein YdhL (DUF1289 family)